MANEMEFDKQSLAKLKKAYNKAVKENKDTFVFEGQELLVSYAKYLIEYLTSRLK
jgi:hypothetical protein